MIKLLALCFAMLGAAAQAAPTAEPAPQPAPAATPAAVANTPPAPTATSGMDSRSGMGVLKAQPEPAADQSGAGAAGQDALANPSPPPSTGLLLPAVQAARGAARRSK